MKATKNRSIIITWSSRPVIQIKIDNQKSWNYLKVLWNFFFDLQTNILAKQTWSTYWTKTSTFEPIKQISRKLNELTA